MIQGIYESHLLLLVVKSRETSWKSLLLIWTLIGFELAEMGVFWFSKPKEQPGCRILSRKCLGIFWKGQAIAAGAGDMYAKQEGLKR